MIGIALTFLRTSLGQYVLIATAVAAAFGTLVLHERGVGVKKERVRVEKQGEKFDAKASDRRRAAEREPDGVLGKYYRD